MFSGQNCLKVLPVILFFVHLLFAQPQTGSIGGKIFDTHSLQPVAGVNVVVSNAGQGAASTEEGYFYIEKLQPGSYNLEFYHLGYAVLKKANIIVNPKRTTVLEIGLTEDVLQGEKIEAIGSYFSDPVDAVVSARSMDFEEIRRSPGDLIDIQRAVQSLPAVVSGSDQINEIIVRGGYPGENLFLLDNIEIPNPNHFPVYGAGGGPINMLNSYMVREIDFYAGAFPVRYGDKASSVMDIKMRNGDEERFRGEASMGFAGIGGLVEGPLGKKANFIFSARKSYLDLIKKQVGLSAVPYYYNFQGRFSWNMNQKNILILNSVYGSDKINLEDEDEAGYGRGAENVDTHGDQLINGVTLRTLWSGNMFSHITASWIRSASDVDVYERLLTGTRDVFFTNRLLENEYALRADFNYLPGRKTEIGFGASVKNIRFNYDIWEEADTLFLFRTGQPGQVFLIYPEWTVNEKISTYKFAGYGQISHKIFDDLRLTGGLRYDYFQFNRFSSLSPRLGLSWMVSPKTSLNMAYGMHFQSPYYMELVANEQNKNLKNKYTRQYITGLEHFFSDDIKLSVEAYYKTYDNVPVPLKYTTPDPLDYDNGVYVNAEKGYSAGAELFFQKKLVRHFSSIVSYSYSVSKRRDERNGKYFNGDYDYRNVLTLIGGYKYDFRPHEWYQSLSKKWWYSIIAWLPFAPADEFEISLKFRYLGGRPYTPPVYHPEFRKWIVEEQQELNTHRYPEYHRLDLRFDQRYFFGSWNLVLFFDFLNVYNRDNIWSYQYNSDGTVSKVLQFQTMPIGGVTLEF
ncbi:MAG: TonB-dependent receptor [Calditrichaceae bacterium]|nr:TonB-dependent receptor [Calditrichaceae bacterium]RQV92965.1 MAG: TonB-dependent receptor [Calditrichota bacterium]